MKIITDKITIVELTQMSTRMFGSLVKAVVDIEKKIMVVDAGLHSDQEELLLENGSEQKNLWGINLYPKLFPDTKWIEFDSMINLRPSWGNFSRSVEDITIQNQIITIVTDLVEQ